MRFWLVLHRVLTLIWRKTDILTILTVKIHWHGIFLQLFRYISLVIEFLLDRYNFSLNTLKISLHCLSLTLLLKSSYCYPIFNVSFYLVAFKILYSSLFFERFTLIHLGHWCFFISCFEFADLLCSWSCLFFIKFRNPCILFIQIYFLFPPTPLKLSHSSLKALLIY